MDDEMMARRDALLTDTKQIIDNPFSTAADILEAVKRHGIAVWQLGQHAHEWTWFCQLSHKALWGDRGWTAKHCATMDDAIRGAAQEYAKEIVI